MTTWHDVLVVVVVAVIGATVAQLLCGRSDRAAHRRDADAEARHRAHMAQVRSGEYGRAVLRGRAGNGPRARALYESYAASGGDDDD